MTPTASTLPGPTPAPTTRALSLPAYHQFTTNTISNTTAPPSATAAMATPPSSTIPHQPTTTNFYPNRKLTPKHKPPPTRHRQQPSLCARHPTHTSSRPSSTSGTTSWQYLYFNSEKRGSEGLTPALGLARVPVSFALKSSLRLLLVLCEVGLKSLPGTFWLVSLYLRSFRPHLS